jgi:hypothetical protein
MPGIILRGQALKIVNKGGGRITKTVVDETVDPMNNKTIKTHKHMQSRERVKGSDYIVFDCPACGKRNKRCAYEVKGRVGNSLSLKCNKCYREIEVAPPAPVNTVTIALPTDRTVSQLLGPDGRSIRG